METAPNPPTVFHLTHWKAGSQWVAEILKYSDRERYIPYVQPAEPGSLFNTPIVPGKIYGANYFNRRQFASILQEGLLPTRFHPSAVENWRNFGAAKSPYRAFVVVRDLRDTLVSLYFSLKFSHGLTDANSSTTRERLQSKDEETGMLDIIEFPRSHPGWDIANSVKIQLSWLNHPGILYLRYEDILGNEQAFFRRLIKYCEIDVPQDRLDAIVGHNVFERVTGRPRGEEDVKSHLRRGIAGDWRNHFTDKIKDRFKRRYGHVLIKTGYEKDLNW